MRKLARGIALMLAAAALLAALAMVAGCKPKEEPLPKTPEEFAIKIFGQGRPDTQDPGVYQVGIDASGELTVMLRFAVLTSDARAQCNVRIVELLKDVFTYSSVQSVFVQIDFPFRDSAGAITLEKGLTMRMRRATAEGIDWATLVAGTISQKADEWWVDERVK